MSFLAQVNNTQDSRLLVDEDLQTIESFIAEQLEKEKAQENLYHHQHHHPHHHYNQGYSTLPREYQQNNIYYFGGMQVKQEDTEQELHHVQLESGDENVRLEELERFVRTFKTRRNKLGFTQGDVGIALGKLYGSDFSQTTISRFEALSLSYKNMCKLKPLLQRWLDAATQSLNNPDSFLNPDHKNHPMNSRRRKKRSSIEPKCRVALEKEFRLNPKPTSEDLEILAEYTRLSKNVVRVWFSNRRQKARRQKSSSSSSSNYELSSVAGHPMQSFPLCVLNSNLNPYYGPVPQPRLPPQYQYPYQHQTQYQQNINFPPMYPYPHPHPQHGMPVF